MLPEQSLISAQRRCVVHLQRKFTSDGPKGFNWTQNRAWYANYPDVYVLAMSDSQGLQCQQLCCSGQVYLVPGRVPSPPCCRHLDYSISCIMGGLTLVADDVFVFYHARRIKSTFCTLTRSHVVESRLFLMFLLAMFRPLAARDRPKRCETGRSMGIGLEVRSENDVRDSSGHLRISPPAGDSSASQRGCRLRSAIRDRSNVQAKISSSLGFDRLVLFVAAARRPVPTGD